MLARVYSSSVHQLGWLHELCPPTSVSLGWACDVRSVGRRWTSYDSARQIWCSSRLPTGQLWGSLIAFIFFSRSPGAGNGLSSEKGKAEGCLFIFQAALKTVSALVSLLLGNMDYCKNENRPLIPCMKLVRNDTNSRCPEDGSRQNCLSRLIPWKALKEVLIYNPLHLQFLCRKETEQATAGLGLASSVHPTIILIQIKVCLKYSLLM